jgi:rubrerythrin
MVTSVGTETDFVEMLCNLLQLDLDAMEAYDAAMARVEKAEYREQLEAFKGDHIRHSEELSKIVAELGGKVSTGPGTKQNITTGGAVLADMVEDKRILEALKANEDDYQQGLRARGGDEPRPALGRAGVARRTGRRTPAPRLDRETTRRNAS